MYITRGKKWTRFTGHDLESILAEAIGRSGNLRAPTLRCGDTYLIGFHDEIYQAVLTPQDD